MPDMPESTLLAHLVPRFASHPENVAVEALGHILGRSTACRQALSDLLRDAGADVGPIARASTQATSEGRKRPDLAAVDDNGDERLLIEVKFWAGLTENQPVTYLERLPADVPSALLVVGPDARRISLWAELRELVEAAEGFVWEDATTTMEVRGADVGHGRKLLLTSWQSLLGRMASRASGTHETDTELDIRQLRGLADRMDSGAVLPIRPEELGPEIPRRLVAYVRLAEEATQSLAQTGVAGHLEQRSASYTGYSGRNLTFAGVRAWLGVWYRPWAELRATPLWLQLRTPSAGQKMSLDQIRQRLRPLVQSDPPALIEGSIVDVDGLLIPITVPIGLEHDAVRESVVARLTEIAALLRDRTD